MKDKIIGWGLVASYLAGLGIFYTINPPYKQTVIDLPEEFSIADSADCFEVTKRSDTLFIKFKNH